MPEPPLGEEEDGVPVVHIKPEAEERDELYDLRFPIHSACYNRASYKVIADLLTSLNKLDAIHEKDDDGHYPLHIACAKKSSYEVIKHLSVIFPEAVKTPLNDGTLPIMCNVATAYQASPQVIHLLLKYHPEAECEFVKSTRTYSDNSTYVGFFNVFGKRSNKGRLTYADGISWYDGEWKNDHFEGWGCYKFPNESLYKGNFKNGKFNGYGDLTIREPDFYGKPRVIRHYRGYFSDGKKHGVGICKYLGGDVYEGEFDKGIREGWGIARYARGIMHDTRGRYSIGAVYEGFWHKDKRHGIGSYRYANGDVAKGEFFQGALHGSVEFRQVNGDYYMGQYVNGKREGSNGILRSVREQCSYEGNFVDGHFQHDAVGTEYLEKHLDEFLLGFKNEAEKWSNQRRWEEFRMKMMKFDDEKRYRDSLKEQRRKEEEKYEKIEARRLRKAQLDAL